MRQKLFHAYWVGGKYYSTPNHYSTKIWKNEAERTLFIPQIGQIEAKLSLFIPQIRKNEAKLSLFIPQIWKIEVEWTRLIPEIGKIEAKKTNRIEVKQTEAVLLNFLWSPGIDSKELIPPAYALAGLYNNPIPARILAPIALKPLKRLQIRAQATLDSGIGSLESIPGLGLSPYLKTFKELRNRTREPKTRNQERLSISVSRGESPTPRIGESGSRRLPVLASWGVVDYPYQRVGESLSDLQ